MRYALPTGKRYGRLVIVRRCGRRGKRTLYESREAKIRARFEAYVRGIGGGSVLRAKTGEYVFSQAGWLDWQAAYAEGYEDGLEEVAIYAEGHSQRGLDAAKAAGKKLYHEDCDKKIAAGIRSLSSRKAGSDG